METTNLTPIETIIELLKNIADPNMLRSLVTDDVTYVSLNYNNPELHKIMPWCGTSRGASKLIENFAKILDCWEMLEFNPADIFGSDERVAIFGSFKYRSKVMNQIVDSPFAIFAKIKDGKVSYMQFMEDTYATAASFRVKGATTYQNFPNTKAFEV
jgi:ketosteroid isomerase-like protein